jgi:AcrR family transcriptional regulator
MAPTKPRPNREEKKAATREALLEAATRVFARQGYVATSVDEVAWEAGMTKGAVYSNFASKDDLFAAVVERHQDRRMLAILDTVDPSRPAAEEALQAAEQFAAAIDPEFFMLTLEYIMYAARHPEGHRAMRERDRRMKKTIAERLEHFVAEGNFPLIMPAEDMVTAFFAIGSGVELERLNNPEETPGDLYSTMLTIFVRGIQAVHDDKVAAAKPRTKRAK